MSHEIQNCNSRIRIIIIDSGFTPHPSIKSFPKEMLTISVSNDGNASICQGAPDLLGHGTAVYSIISEDLKDVADVIVVKIFDNSMYTDEMRLILALEYCVNTLAPNIIHMSNGITCCENLKRLKQICTKAFERGIYIVAAFDNFGAITYPATFEEVIGVDVSDEIRTGYIFCDRNDVNIVVPNISRRVPWINNTYFSSNGTSFNACYVTIQICKRLFYHSSSRSDIMNYLRNEANMIVDNGMYELPIKRPNIKRAIVLPFNKEIRTLVRYMTMLDFEIVGIYEIKYSRIIGMCVWDVLNIQKSNNKKNMIINTIDSIDWEKDFDTVIVGHLSEIDRITHRNYSKYIVAKCLEYGKSIISLGKLNIDEDLLKLFKTKGLTIYYPHISKTNVPKLYKGKLRKIGIPILGIFGTSSKQGKFSLQLELRHFFQSQGYTIGQLGTEPTSTLFNFDEVYPMGYEGTVEVLGESSIAVINDMLGRIEDKNPDLIIVGAQSQTIPQYRGNLSFFVLRQHEFILGAEPDAILLCVNIFDDDTYVENTIRYIESIVDSEVIGLVLFPMRREFINGIMTNKLMLASASEVAERKVRLQDRHGRPVFIAGEEIEAIGTLCLQYFLA